MLLYHPAFDINHCIFRILRLLTKLSRQPYETARIRILDFYLLFPELLQQVRFPKELVSHRKAFKKEPNPYQVVLDPHRVFLRIEPYQSNALKCLASYGLVDAKTLANDRVIRTDVPLPEALQKAIAEADSRSHHAIDLLSGPFSNIELYGSSGLKARTDLFEYRYDIA